MDTPAKHYKFINSQTGNVIYYYTAETGLNDEALKEKLDAIKLQVATSNGIFMNNVYWEQIPDA
jgi:hypothetical protein